MLRGFRHTLFLLLQVGTFAAAGVAVVLWPESWPAIAACTAGSFLAAIVCERVASRYLRKTLGRLRRAADDIGHGRRMATLDAQPGDDLYKLVSAINLLAARLAQASEEERRLQEELRRRERLAFLGELAATVAHEVNNPLDGVQNCSRILRRCVDDPVRARQMLDYIDDGVRRIDLIVRKLLTLAREHVIRPAEASIRGVVESALRGLAERFEANGIRVRIEKEADDDLARVDALLLEHVFANLLTNAADSMPGGGEITVRIAATEEVGGAYVRIEVADSGTGIRPEDLGHIFEPFFTTKTDGKGTGLGLAIAQRIVDAHRGSITVHARPEGGTVFAVLIPALSAASNTAGELRPVAPAGDPA